MALEHYVWAYHENAVGFDVSIRQIRGRILSIKSSMMILPFDVSSENSFLIYFWNQLLNVGRIFRGSSKIISSFPKYFGVFFEDYIQFSEIFRSFRGTCSVALPPHQTFSPGPA